MCQSAIADRGRPGKAAGRRRAGSFSQVGGCMRLKDRVAIVTGGSQGIGEAIARRFAAEGAKVAILNRDQKKAAAVVVSIREAGGEALAVQADIGRVGQIEAAVTNVVDAYGTVHILVNNAGLYLMSRLGETTEATFDAMIDTNLKAVFFLCQSVLPLFERQGHGKILNIGSIFGNDGYPQLSGLLRHQGGDRAAD